MFRARTKGKRVYELVCTVYMWVCVCVYHVGHIRSGKNMFVVDPVLCLLNQPMQITACNCTYMYMRVMSRFAHKGLEAFDEPLFLSPTLCYPNPLNPNPTFVLCLSPTP